MNSPRVSIITPNFNKGKFVEDCIASVRQQTFSEWEMLFVDDGSTDGSDAIAERAAKADSRLKILRNPAQTKGAAHARNLGLKQAAGDLILFLDSDDLLDEKCLESRVDLMDASPDLDYAVFPTAIFNRTKNDSPFISNIPKSDSNLHRFLMRDIVWLISGPIWRKRVLMDLKGFDPLLHSQQDYDIHVRALIAGYRYKYLHTTPQVFYRQDVESLPRKMSQTVEHFRARYEMTLRHHGLLAERKMVTPAIKRLLARQILDLSQMMRWHRVELGAGGALRMARDFWNSAKELGLVDKKDFQLGSRYIRFKHAMIFNRTPAWQRKIENGFQRKLGDLIFHPSATYCKVTMDDYEG